MFPLGLGIALAIRLGATISRNVPRARQLALGTLCFSFVIFGSTAILMYRYRAAIFRIFTNEPEVIELCNEIWFDVCFYFFNLCFFAICIGISIGLGMQWTLGIVTVISLWCLGLPASYYFSIIRGGGLNAACKFKLYELSCRCRLSVQSELTLTHLLLLCVPRDLHLATLHTHQFLHGCCLSSQRLG
jgi:Na+-driven multidrug efflux pump